MAIVLDMSWVLSQVEKKRTQQTFNVVKDPLVEQLNSEDPLNFGSFLREQLDQEIEGTFSHSSRIARHNDSTDAKVIVKAFSDSYNPKSNFKFSRDTTIPVPPRSSALSGLIRQGLQQAHIQPTKTFTFKVFLPSGESVKLTATATETVEEVIKATIQQYIIQCNDAKKDIRIDTNHQAYVLRFAEDGEPDEDMPALMKSQEIGQYKGTDFALCPDSNFKAFGSEPAPVFKVFLPNEEGFITLAWNPELTLQAVMEVVCRKRAYKDDGYLFEHYETGSVLTMSITLEELGQHQVRMSSKETRGKHAKSRVTLERLGKIGSHSNLPFINMGRRTLSNADSQKYTDLGGDAPKQITKRLGPIFYFTDQTAVKLQIYTVVKINKFGKMQERTMAIDSTKITNGAPETKFKGKSKNPERLLTDIQKVWINPSKTTQFFIQYKDKLYHYESDKTEEIVAKIQYLLKMLEEKQKRVERTQ